MKQLLNAITCNEPKRLIKPVFWNALANLSNLLPFLCLAYIVSQIYEYFVSGTLNRTSLWVAWGVMLISLYETYEQTCIKNGTQLKVNLSEDTYPVLNTDKDRLFQILCIFMDNAIQHAKDNSLLEIQAVHTKHQIAFSVIDHGQGITDEDKKYIFDRFFSAGVYALTSGSTAPGTTAKNRRGSPREVKLLNL